jgi:general secretion pathway protein I
MKIQAQKAFTLIEVMVALSVIAIGLIATLKAINQEIAAANISQNKMMALWLLENKAAEIRLNPILPSSGLTQGKQFAYQQTWLWQINTQTTANPKILKSEISISKPSFRNESELLLKQAIYLGDLR